MSMKMKHYDIVVIGSGGGSKITRPAADLGFSVAVIEKDRLGGTCLNHGCIPSKMLIHPADIANTIEEASRFQLDASLHGVAFSELVTRVNTTIDKESASIAPLYEKHPNIDYYHGEAKFVGLKKISISGNEITGDKIFIAAGCRPKVPEIEGLAQTPYLTYLEALRLRKQPKQLIIIGGGYIACELGHYFSALGSKTDLIVRSRLLRAEDTEIAAEFTRTFGKQVNLHVGSVPKKVIYKEGLWTVKCSDKTLRGDGLFIASGVRSNSDTLDLDKTRVKVDSQGFIQVDSYLQTSQAGIYAFGDIIGRALFRHTANYEGQYLFESAVAKRVEDSICYPPVPHAVFSSPQIGGVGLREEDCQGREIIIGRCRYEDSAMGMALLSEDGFAKVIFDASSKKLIGAHIVGYEASTMIHMAIAYMKMGASLDDMLDTIYIHPALPEILRNACRNAETQFRQMKKETVG